MKLSQKINITLFFAIVTPLVVPVFLLFKNINEFQEKSLINLLSSISSGLVASITFESKDGAEAYLQDTVQNIPEARYAVVFTADGKLFAQWGEAQSAVSPEWVSSVLKGEEFIGVSGEDLIVGVPVYDTSADRKDIIGAFFLTAKKRSIMGDVVTLMLGVGFISAAIFGIATTILRGVSRRIDLIVQEISKSSEGKLASVPFSSDDEIGLIARSWNDLVDKLREVVLQITDYSRNVEEISTKVSSGSAELSQSVEHQIANLAEIARSIEKFTETLKEISENMVQVSTLAQESLEVAKTGADSSRTIEETIKEFSLTMKETAETFAELSASVMRINQITDTVRDIAEKTNLLSLNASIEAARAGEAGRGFAVVAQEVGDLAAKTGEELAKIEETTRAVLNAVEKVRVNLERIKDDFRKVESQSRVMRSDFAKILEKSENTSSTAHKVSQEVSGHLSAMEDISARVNFITQANEQIGTMAFDLAKVAEEMKMVADKLYETVKFFEIQSGGSSG